MIPTLARDMVDPTQFDEMINWAFVIATGTYAVLGVAGYVMFGNSVSDEVRRSGRVIIAYVANVACSAVQSGPD